MKSLGFILPAYLVSLVFLGSDNPYLPPNHSDSASVLGVLALGYGYTVRLDLSYEWIVKSLFAVPLALGMVLFLKDKKQLHAILWVLTGCAGWVTVLGICQQLQPSLIKIYNPAFPSLAIFENTNLFACYLVIHFPLAIYFSGIQKRDWKNLSRGLLVS